MVTLLSKSNKFPQILLPITITLGVWTSVNESAKIQIIVLFYFVLGATSSDAWGLFF